MVPVCFWSLSAPLGLPLASGLLRGPKLVVSENRRTYMQGTLLLLFQHGGAPMVVGCTAARAWGERARWHHPRAARLTRFLWDS